MRSVRTLCLLVVFFVLWTNSFAESTLSDGPLTERDSSDVERMVEVLVRRMKNQMWINKKNDELGRAGENKYVVFQEVGDGVNFKMISKNQRADKPVWDENHLGIQQTKEKIQLFNRGHNDVQYYVLVASIYNFLDLEEKELSEPPDWSKMPNYSKVKSGAAKEKDAAEAIVSPYSKTLKTNSSEFSKFFFKTLKDQLGTLSGNNIIHIVASFYIPYTDKATSKQKYALFHHQGLTGTSNYRYNALSSALSSAELKINSIKQKESWLSAAVDYATYAYTNAKEHKQEPDKTIKKAPCTLDVLDTKVQVFADVLNARPDPNEKLLVQEFQKNTNGTLNAQISWAMDIVTDKNYFVLIPDTLKFYSDEQKLKDVDNKIGYLYSKLKTKDSDTYFYVVIQNIGCALENTKLIEGFAKKVYEKSTLKGKKCILMTIPIWETGRSYDDRQHFYQVGQADIFDNTSLLENQDVIFGDVQNVPYVIESTYRQIKKPYTRYDAYLTVSGGMDFQEYSLTSVSGYNAINDLYLWVKPEYHEFKANEEPDRSDFMEYDVPQGYYVEDAPLKVNETKYSIALFNYIIKRNDILTRAANDPNNWQVYKANERLNEWCIPDSYKAFAKYVFKEEGFGKWWQGVQVLVDVHDVDRSCIQNFDAMAVVDPIVYTVIDVASVIPVIDTFADGAGLLYATGRGDLESAGMYAVGLTVPFVGGAVVKGVTKGTKLMINGVTKSGRILLRGTLYVVKEGEVLLHLVISKAEELKIVARQMLKFKNAATAIADDKLLKLTRVLQSGDAAVVEKIVKIADDANLDDAQKLERVIKLMDDIDFNLAQVKQGIEAALGNRVTVTSTGNTVEVLVKETEERIMVVCNKTEQQGLEYAVKSNGQDAFVDVTKETGWTHVGDNLVDDATIKVGNNTVQDALVVVEKTDQGKKIIRIGNCFPAGHLIHFSHNKTKPIEQVQQGDSVLSVNTATGIVERNVVTRTFKRTTTKLAWIYSKDGLICQSTPEHPFWSANKQQYVEAENLVKGDQLATLNQQLFASAKPYGSHTSLEIDHVLIKDTTLTVYNFEVEGRHNYFVGDDGVLVHNADYGGPIKWTNPIRKKFADAGLAASEHLPKFRSILERTNLSEKAADGLIKLLKTLPADDVAKAAARLEGLGDNAAKFLEDVNAGLGSVNWTRWDDELMDGWKILSNGAGSLRTADNIKAINAFRKANPSVTDEAIQNAFEGLKSSRRQAFISGLEKVAKNENLVLKNSRLATADEVRDAVNTIRDFRAANPSVPSGKNLGALDGTVNGKSASELSSHDTWISGDDTPLTSKQVWEADYATSPDGKTWFRSDDSEFKMLNDLARKLQPDAVFKEGVQYTQHTGEIKIISELGYCTSCQGIIQKFNNMFPNIKIVLIDAIK